MCRTISSGLEGNNSTYRVPMWLPLRPIAVCETTHVSVQKVKRKIKVPPVEGAHVAAAVGVGVVVAVAARTYVSLFVASTGA